MIQKKDDKKNVQKFVTDYLTLIRNIWIAIDENSG